MSFNNKQIKLFLKNYVFSNKIFFYLRLLKIKLLFIKFDIIFCN